MYKLARCASCAHWICHICTVRYKSCLRISESGNFWMRTVQVKKLKVARKYQFIKLLLSHSVWLFPNIDNKSRIKSRRKFFLCPNLYILKMNLLDFLSSRLRSIQLKNAENKLSYKVKYYMGSCWMVCS